VLREIEGRLAWVPLESQRSRQLSCLPTEPPGEPRVTRVATWFDWPVRRRKP
jgi:hypothetical protein